MRPRKVDLALLFVPLIDGDAGPSEFTTWLDQSKITAHPGHLHDRGERCYRARLSEFLVALHGGQE